MECSALFSLTAGPQKGLGASTGVRGRTSADASATSAYVLGRSWGAILSCRQVFSGFHWQASARVGI